MKPVLPPEDTRPHVVMGTMAAGFLLLAAFFFVSGLFNLLVGKISTRGGPVLRAESPELFAKLVWTGFGFGLAMLAITALCG